MKVLLSGDINGKWNALFKRVTAVNKSNGPFDVLLCTGGTFADAGDTLGIRLLQRLRCRTNNT